MHTSGHSNIVTPWPETKDVRVEYSGLQGPGQTDTRVNCHRHEGHLGFANEASDAFAAAKNST